MNVGIWTEATQFLFREYLKWNFWYSVHTYDGTRAFRTFEEETVCFEVDEHLVKEKIPTDISWPKSIDRVNEKYSHDLPL
jgi:hypothetical protein